MNKLSESYGPIEKNCNINNKSSLTNLKSWNGMEYHRPQFGNEYGSEYGSKPGYKFNLPFNSLEPYARETNPYVGYIVADIRPPWKACYEERTFMNRTKRVMEELMKKNPVYKIDENRKNVSNIIIGKGINNNYMEGFGLTTFDSLSKYSWLNILLILIFIIVLCFCIM